MSKEPTDFFIPKNEHDPRLSPFARLIYVSGKRCALFLIEKGRVVLSFRVSVAKKGFGSRKGSQRTQLGWHRISEKIGAGASAGTVFKDRVNTGELWDGKSQYGDLILSRILRLEGLEDGKNRGGEVDTHERYIYMHGTNHTRNIGKPSSSGCVTFKCKDIIELFSRVRKGDPLVITRS